MGRITLYPAIAFVALAPPNTVNWGWQPENPVAFAKPFPPHKQQFAAHTLRSVPTAPTPQGWQGQQLETRFAKPYPAAAQPFFATGLQGNIPTAKTPQGWQGQQLEYRYAKPFPSPAQQFLALPSRHVPEESDVQGWYGQQLDVRFAKPFPVTEQIFSVWDLVGDVPPFAPPGAGRRRDIPSYIPQPPDKVRPNKPFRPIWDRGPPAKAPAPSVAATPPPPAPLPPSELFAAPAAPPASVTASPPDFDHLVPADPLGLARRMQEAQDRSDAIAVLKALGLIRES